LKKGEKMKISKIASIFFASFVVFIISCGGSFSKALFSLQIFLTKGVR